MQVPSAALDWAQQRFAGFSTPDPRRRSRLIQMGAAVLTHPAGRVTRVFPHAAAQQGAYDWLEHSARDARALARCEAAAAVGACRGEPFAWVPVDLMDLSIVDHSLAKGTGRLASDRRPVRGFLVTTAFVVRADESAAGVAVQSYWARPAGALTDSHERALADKETRFWGNTLRLTVARFAAWAPGCRPWFLCDRGADFAEFILEGLRQEWLWTVRAKHDRRVIDLAHERLRAQVAAQPILGWATVRVEDSSGHPRVRIARVALRATPVVLHLSPRLDPSAWAASVWAVGVTEVDPPHGAEALSWLLLTSYPTEDFADAMLVVQGYGRRTRIEEYHRVWKTGGCDVQNQQLRSPQTIEKWSRLLSSVAVRLLQLRDASRLQPAAPASEWFTPLEVEATVLLRQPRDHSPLAPPTLGRMVRWIAELGGYTGRSSGGPPGITVIRRGWEKVAVAVEVLARQRQPP